MLFTGNKPKRDPVGKNETIPQLKNDGINKIPSICRSLKHGVFPILRVFHQLPKEKFMHRPMAWFVNKFCILKIKYVTVNTPLASYLYLRVYWPKSYHFPDSSSQRILRSPASLCRTHALFISLLSVRSPIHIPNGYIIWEHIRYEDLHPARFEPCSNLISCLPIIVPEVHDHFSGEFFHQHENNVTAGKAHLLCLGSLSVG